jgi:hypothetical protein
MNRPVGFCDLVNYHTRPRRELRQRRVRQRAWWPGPKKAFTKGSPWTGDVAWDENEDFDFDPEPVPTPEPEPEATPQPVASEFQRLREKVDTAVAETVPVHDETAGEPTVFDFPEVAPAVEPVSAAEPAAVVPQTACVARNASRAAAAVPKPRVNRRQRRAQELAARKAEFWKVRFT